MASPRLIPDCTRAGELVPACRRYAWRQGTVARVEEMGAATAGVASDASWQLRSRIQQHLATHGEPLAGSGRAMAGHSLWPVPTASEVVIVLHLLFPLPWPTPAQHENRLLFLHCCSPCRCLSPQHQNWSMLQRTLCPPCPVPVPTFLGVHALPPVRSQLTAAWNRLG